MTHRLLVVCLGGLAGAGALVCCDLDEGLDEETAALDADRVEGTVADAAPAEPQAEAVLH